jgi:hypothetical protein
LLTPVRRDELQPQTRSVLQRMLQSNSYTRVFVTVGRFYWPLVSSISELVPVEDALTVGHGGIGQRGSQLVHWIEAFRRQCLWHEGESDA